MAARITRAAENNLKNVDAIFSDGLTVVTGVSGSGKSSLVFDTLYREGQNRFNETFGNSSGPPRTVNVEAVDDLGPVISLEQNTLNRNPNSTVGTASGLHPFFRILFAKFGDRFCPVCSTRVEILDKPLLLKQMSVLVQKSDLILGVPLVHKLKGSHRTLLDFLAETYPLSSLILDNTPGLTVFEDPTQPHSIELRHWTVYRYSSLQKMGNILQNVLDLGIPVVTLYYAGQSSTYTLAPACPECRTPIPELSPTLFNLNCSECKGKGCKSCSDTGLHSAATVVLWEGYNLSSLLDLTVQGAQKIFNKADFLPNRLNHEIRKRLDALCDAGLGYVSLKRPLPSLSRGEAQRLRLALSLTCSLEDMVHILDEPTIGQHPWNVRQIIPQFKSLPGPVIFVEHDKTAASLADWAVDLGPGAGSEGGEVLLNSSYGDLLESESPTGKHFRLEKSSDVPERVPTGRQRILSFKECSVRNLKSISVDLPLDGLTVITGVSGSGKSTLFEEVIYKSIKAMKPVNCREYKAKNIESVDSLTVVEVDQNPIGKNPRSNPGTYTKLSDLIRDLFARETGRPAGLFSFNTERGRCPDCSGIGAREVKMHYLPSFWETCESCSGRRFNEEALSVKANFGGCFYNIEDFYKMSLSELTTLIEGIHKWPGQKRALNILTSLINTGLGYLSLGQPSPTLSGGEAQRIKLARYLSRSRLKNTVFLLDEPSTGLHPADIAGLLHVFSLLKLAGAAVVIIEHNMDIIRAADWVVDLGPYAGHDGGKLMYQGSLKGLYSCPDSLTGEALREEEHTILSEDIPLHRPHLSIHIEKARANNLKSLTLDIPKGKLTVIGGVSGSGKSSLLRNVLEAESRRRYLETLTMYERQGIKESAEPEVEFISGLGVTAEVSQGQRMFNPRFTVGSQTEMVRHLAVLFAGMAIREEKDALVHRLEPRHFLPGNYGSSCPCCNGLGFRRRPNPDKLIIHPEKPLTAGAMYSPGFFPQGYLSKPYNGGYYVIQALGRHFGFIPLETPWQEMTIEAQEAFLFGTDSELDVYYENKKGVVTHKRQGWEGFFQGWVGEWDLGGTYTDKEQCVECSGSGWDEPFRTITLGGLAHHRLYTMTLEDLYSFLEGLAGHEESAPWFNSFLILERRLRFLCRVGLGYLALDRQTATLSAGEAMRVRLSSLLGSRLTNLTVLLDEPTRGMHPCEVEALLSSLEELRDGGNTVVMVEHDLDCIFRADHFIELGPTGGSQGGQILYQGSPRGQNRGESPTLCAAGLQDLKEKNRTALGSLILKGAAGNNLNIENIVIPLGVLTGICGVSGSGKSTLIIDTIGRICAPKKHTTSMSQETLAPEKYDSLSGVPEKVFILDQSRSGLRSPGDYLGITPKLETLFAMAEDVEKEQYQKRCPTCRGRGVIKEDMGFLPPLINSCEACGGTGIPLEMHENSLLGYSFPQMLQMTLEELSQLFFVPEEKENSRTLSGILGMAVHFGIGYLKNNQSASSLSGGEAQRLKIIKEVLKKKSSGALFILDEPTVGLHMNDVNRLFSVLNELVEQGNSVFVIEHNVRLLASCDWLVELGPGGGPRGGSVIFQGLPGNMTDTPTAPYMNRVLHG
jgi:excinuclease ABC subunit A